MSYGTPEWQKWVLNEEEGIKQIKFVYEYGIQTFDTANMCSNGQSEIVLGKAIKQLNLPRDEIVVMTKIYMLCKAQPHDLTRILLGIRCRRSRAWLRGIRKHIFEGVKHSLERLQLDYIDVLQCNFPTITLTSPGHRCDPNTPFEETMQALHDVVKAGYVRYVGMSSCYAWQFHAMQNYAINNGLTPFISMQNHYNLLYREEEREMFPTLKHFGVGSIPWSPLARGKLTRPISSQVQTERSQSDPWVSLYGGALGAKDIVTNVEALANKKGVSMAQIAIAWALSKEGVTAPIVGTTSLKNLEDILGAIDVKLTEEEIKLLEEPYKAQAVAGH
ncbi:aryl-alcohol dehydrogenase [Pleurotus eryngii]|uniref:Aryl-alcohol dehydrogenase n=1 Tax=Pleurotus eryngii TaxID=5323 RepID=A0A9P6AB02_PLEER|nr:aryl-alcohol dehydrogenase [Pleurotus eryngii]